MTVLEARYRRLLWLHPAGSDRDDLLATLLDVARDGQTRPGLGSAVEVTCTSLRRRFRHASSVGSSISTWAAALGLGSATGLALSALLLGELRVGPFGARGGDELRTVGPFLTTGVVTYLMVVTVAAFAVAGRSSRLGLRAAVASTLLPLAAGPVLPLNRPPLYLLGALFLMLLGTLSLREPLPARVRWATAVVGAITFGLCAWPSVHDPNVVQPPYARYDFYRGVTGPAGARTGIALLIAVALACALATSAGRARVAPAVLLCAAAWSPVLLVGFDGRGVGSAPPYVPFLALVIGASALLWTTRPGTVPRS